MAGEWREATLDDIAEFRNGKAIPLERYSALGRHPVFGSNGQIARTDDVLNTEPIIVIGRVGAYCGSVYYISEASWVTDNAIVALPKFGNDLRFLFYLFSSLELQRTAIGSAQPLMTQGGLKVVRTKVPLLSEQQAIAGVLGSLDDKIESNRRTSRALERVARAIFRAWFVDFEPVKAKAAGARSFSGMPQDVFDALPIRFVESKLGPMPEGWEVGCIGDSVNVRGGGTPSTTVEEYWKNGSHCWLTPKDLSGMKDHILLTTARKITDKGLDKISSGLLPIGTVLLSSRAPVGYLVLSGVATAINQGFIAMVCDGPLPPLYVFHWTQSVMDEIKSRASGTTFPEISKAAFRPIKVCIPTKPVLDSFTAVVEPLFKKLAANIRESQSLERLRDYLLPKLMSGEVQVVVPGEMVSEGGHDEV